MKKVKSSMWVAIVLVLLAATRPAYAETADKSIDYRFSDGVALRVHFSEATLAQSGETPAFARQVLDAAVLAYQTISEFQGFSANGYSFAHPDTAYAFDPDRTIDIYLGHPDQEWKKGSSTLAFKDAPCFDTLMSSPNAYDAVILLPSNYREFIRNWEKINPSPLGKRNIDVDLRGTLTHEMLHAVLFYYHKNLGRSGAGHSGTKTDWYIEGLARYFETLVGARHDFYSQGFKEMLKDKVRFSRGGSNYFMRFPDQAFTELRYENALFWRFLDERYGMPAIETMSRRLRDDHDFEKALEQLSGMPFAELLKTFARALLDKDFGLKDDSDYLHEVARSREDLRDGNFYLKDGFGGEKALGRECAVDWIGSWETLSSTFGEPPVAGDSTDRADVSAWATDFHEITPQGKLPWIGVRHDGGDATLAVQIFVRTKGGSSFRREIPQIRAGQTLGVSVGSWVRKEGLESSDVARIDLLVTNTHREFPSEYTLVSR